jgi:multidrug efflux system membrane fusion protein
VSTGPIDGNVTAINSGLSAGDRVVIDGTDRLRDGIKVIVVAGEGRQTGAPAGAPTAAPGGVPNRGQPSGQHSGSSQNRPPSGNQ